MFNSWDEIDNALRRIGEIQIALDRIKGEMNIAINEAKARAESASAPLLKEKKELEKAITDFCESHKDEFLGKRRKTLNFGIIAYRVTTRIVIRSVKATVKAMETLGLLEYLRVEKKPDREKMLELDDATLARVGATRKVEDKLRIEPALEKIRNIA